MGTESGPIRFILSRTNTHLCTEGTPFTMPKEARIDLRAEPETVERLKKAATADRRSLSQYLVFYGLQEADRILGHENP